MPKQNIKVDKADVGSKEDRDNFLYETCVDHQKQISLYQQFKIQQEQFKQICGVETPNTELFDEYAKLLKLYETEYPSKLEIDEFKRALIYIEGESYAFNFHSQVSKLMSNCRLEIGLELQFYTEQDDNLKLQTVIEYE